MITINYTRQAHGAHHGLRSIQFVLDENMGMDGMLHELTQFLRAMGYPIDSDETLIVLSEDELEALYSSVNNAIDSQEVEKIMNELIKDDDDKE